MSLEFPELEGFELKSRQRVIELTPEYMHIIGTFVEYRNAISESEKTRLVDQGLMEASVLSQLMEAKVVLFNQGVYFLNPKACIDNINDTIKVDEEIR